MAPAAAHDGSREQVICHADSMKNRWAQHVSPPPTAKQRALSLFPHATSLDKARSQNDSSRFPSLSPADRQVCHSPFGSAAGGSQHGRSSRFRITGP